MAKMQSELDKILKEAKQCPVKGRLYMYEKYKLRVQDLGLSSEEYTQACRQLANNLEV